MSVISHSMQFDNICRTCLSEEPNMKSVFDTDCSLGKTHQLYQMLIACASVQVQEDDGLPSQICRQCINHIARSFSFKKLCEDSDSTLREVLRKSIKTDDEPLVEIKPLLDVALCSQETDAAIDVNMLDIKVKIEEGETKMDDLISDTQGAACEIDDMKMMTNIDDLEPETIEPNENTKSDAIKADRTVGSSLKIDSDTHQTLPLKCEECGNECGSSSVLTRHVKEVHGIAKSHVCHQCGRCFNSSSHLTRHLRTHTTGKKRSAKRRELLEPKRAQAHENMTFICSECGRGFLRRNCFVYHHSTNPLIKVCVCEVCGKQ